MTLSRTLKVEVLSSKFLQPEPAATNRQGLVETWRRTLTVLFGVLVAVCLLGLGSHWERYVFIHELLFFTGVCLAAVGMLGRIWSHLYVAGYKTRKLIRTGPYSLCRNPLYFFSAIGLVGIGLCSGTLTVPFVMVLFFAAYYPLVIRSEEQRLKATHHESFVNYCETVPAFWPRTGNYEEPETYSMVPRLMRKGILDAFWFLFLAALTQVVADLHVADVLPDVYRLW